MRRIHASPAHGSSDAIRQNRPVLPGGFRTISQLAILASFWYHKTNAKGGDDMRKPLSAGTLGQRAYHFRFS